MVRFNGNELPNENPVRQISSNYFIVDINDVIDAKILDHYLKTEFEYSNINIDYENYGNFINFSSAQTRLENFYYKKKKRSFISANLYMMMARPAKK